MDLQHLFTQENILFIPVFLIVISVLVAAHEYGHYLFARIFGMGVEEFAIGFGPKAIWTYRRKQYLVPLKGMNGQVLEVPKADSSAQPSGGIAKAALMLEGAAPRLESPGIHGESSSLMRKVIAPEVVETPDGPALRETTNFTVRPIPVGGFVRIKGMMPEEDGRETLIPGGFYSKEPWKRFIVLLAGPVFSVLAGCILIFILFATVGQLKADEKPVLGQVMADSPAHTAGLRDGDRIVSVDSTPTKSFYEVVSHIRFGGEKQHTIVYQRGGKQYTTQVTPQVDATPSPVLEPDMTPGEKMEKQAKIGALPSSHYERLSIGRAAVEAIGAPVKAVAALGSLLRTPSKLKDSVGGPITMLRETRAAVQAGPPDIIAFAAIISISVGIFNLLPFPPLDGGQMAIALAEMFRRGRRLSMKVQNMTVAAGMFVVLLLFVTVFTIDIQRLGKSDSPKFKQAPKQNPVPAQPKSK